jgi:hypothetical protein
MFLLGTVVVFTGILPICKDENGLAAVLGHGDSSHPSHVGDGLILTINLWIQRLAMKASSSLMGSPIHV